MKKLLSFALCFMAVFAAGQLLADAITNTMAALPAITSVAADMTPGQMGALVMQALLGLAFAMPLQAFIEHAIAEKPWMNTAPASWFASPVLKVLLSNVPSLSNIKPLLPSLISGALGWACVHAGVDPQKAIAFAATLTAATHAVNASPLASEATEFVPAPKAAV